ncbi:FtsX-like permease family protein [Cellulomonas phragmiteti]|uniref:ABC3 transporter permease C-terminal domain-containing protein n=1 Tax=Cellulomonas phragmiteti TaxID=478780 RepID=A0ABQ4DM50_9CELL|nr:FtsX-like permease family protein [Cellulomonas phragmiteti]GIG40429.1 hypothetical protein Cph01nite_21910 [Cellulomonas phragmiteti]
MPWRPRVLRGRLRDQAPVVLVVALVAVTATTLVGVLAGLLHLAQTDAVPAALGQLAPERVRLEATVRVDGEDTDTALSATRDGLARLTGDVPTTEETWLTSPLYALPAEVPAQPHLVYLSALPHTDDLVELVDGRWPQRATDDAGRVEVNVPALAARELGWQVGDQVDARPWGTAAYGAWVVVGTHERTGPRSSWSRDRLLGGVVDRGFSVPGTIGRERTTLWGPALVDADALRGTERVHTAYVTVLPALGDASSEAVAALRAQVRDGAAILSETLGAQFSGRLRTDVGATIDATWRELVVTRAGVMTTGILLATLAATVMLLAARLLAERRATESELLAARGASPGQLRSVVVLEAAALAGGTWLVAPWLGRAVLDAMTRSGALADAGYRVGAGVPAGVLLSCAVMAVVLAVALCVPAWHTAGSSTGTSHAGLLRAGGDVALLALGGLAMWRLVVHGSPLVGGADGPQADPVLVAGPALVTLAAATVSLRLVAPVARVADVLAGRARSLVVPLAAWQVARRSSVASGTVLVVVVAVVAGTFSAAFAGTWRTSQLAQVDLATGTDLRLDDIADAPLTVSAAAAAAVAGLPGAHGQPVVDRVVGIGRRGNVGGLSARVVAVDVTRPQDLRGAPDRPWHGALAGLAPDVPAAAAGLPLPVDTQWLVLDAEVDVPEGTEGRASVSLTVEDDQGVLTTFRSGMPLRQSLALEHEMPAVGPLRVVAVSADVVVEAAPPEIAEVSYQRGIRQPLPLTLTLTDLRTVPRSAGAVRGADAHTVEGTPVTPATAGWDAAVLQDGASVGATAEGTPADARGATLRLAGEMWIDVYRMMPARLTARAWTPADHVPVAVTRSILDDIDVYPGQALTLAVDGVAVDARVERLVEHVPGAPRGVAVLADRTTLARAVLDAGGDPSLVDAWWVAAPDPATATVVQRLAEAHTDADVSTRAGLRQAALTGPVGVAVPAALSLVAGSAALLLLVGTGAVAAAALRARRLELARLQALGASRPGLVGGLLAEGALLVVVGAAAGLAAGYGLSAVVAPLLTMSPDGRTPVPAPWLVWGWGAQTLRTLAVVLGACGVVALVALVGVRRTSGAALRMGDDR